LANPGSSAENSIIVIFILLLGVAIPVHVRISSERQRMESGYGVPIPRKYNRFIHSRWINRLRFEKLNLFLILLLWSPKTRNRSLSAARTRVRRPFSNISWFIAPNSNPSRDKTSLFPTDRAIKRASSVWWGSKVGCPWGCRQDKKSETGEATRIVRYPRTHTHTPTV
jgi:hypothetical protein